MQNYNDHGDSEPFCDKCNKYKFNCICNVEKELIKTLTLVGLALVALGLINSLTR